MEALTHLLTQSREGGQVESPIEMGDASMEEDELVEDGQELGQRKPTAIALRPFRSAASPTGVAKTHLKAKDNKDHKDSQEARAKEKEDKQYEQPAWTEELLENVRPFLGVRNGRKSWMMILNST